MSTKSVPWAQLRARVILGALAASFIPACVIWPEDDHYEDDYYDDDYIPPPEDTTVYTTIDAGNQLDTELGYGAGMFVEYAEGGRWTLWTSCDVELTGRLCTWEVNVYAYSGYVSDIAEYDMEGYDHVDYGNGNGLSFYAETGGDSDSVEFYADPGAYMEIEVFLDGQIAPEYFVWYGDGYVHDGASGTPVVFQPDIP